MTTLFGPEAYTAADGSSPGANYTNSNIGTGSTVDINGNRLRLHLGTGTGYNSHQARSIISGMSAATATELTAKVTVGLHGTTNEHFGTIWCRASSDWVVRVSGSEVGPENGYGLTMDPGNDFIGIQESAAHNWGGAADFQPFTFVTDGVYQIRFQLISSTIRGRIWLDGTGEPGTWNCSVTDSTTTSGKCQLHHYNGDNVATDFFFDDLLITDGASTVLSPSAIGSGEAFGTTVIVPPPQTVSPGGIASAEAFGTTFVNAIQVLSPSAIASGEALGVLTIQSGVIVSPGGVASAQAFGTAVIIPGITSVGPSAIASGEALGNPSIPQSQTVTLIAGIASSQVFGTPVISVGVVIITVSGIATGVAFGTLTIVAGVVTVSPTGIVTAAAFGTASLSTTSPLFLYTGYWGPISQMGVVKPSYLQLGGA